MSKKRLIERLNWYYPQERVHIFVTFPVLLLFLIFINPIKNIIFLAYGMIVCIVIQYQGPHYWKLKLQRLKGEKADNDKNFFSSKKINLLLIGLIPVFPFVQLFILNWNIRKNQLFFWAVLANGFAVLEYINYYHIQLMIDNKYDFEYVIKSIVR